MAKTVLNPVFQGISGRLGDCVFYHCGQTRCVRRYVKPANPDTESQRQRRILFGAAIRSWQMLPESGKRQWHQQAADKNRNGYNYYVSEFMKNQTECIRSQDGIKEQMASGAETPDVAGSCHVPVVSHNNVNKKVSELYHRNLVYGKATPFHLQCTHNDRLLQKMYLKVPVQDRLNTGRFVNLFCPVYQYQILQFYESLLGNSPFFRSIYLPQARGMSRSRIS